MPSAHAAPRLRYEPGARRPPRRRRPRGHRLPRAASGPCGGGFLGVDVFFVLSGYLITSLLLAEHADTGRIDLAAFWARRARRLLPALLLLLLGVAVYSAVRRVLRRSRPRSGPTRSRRSSTCRTGTSSWSDASYFDGVRRAVAAAAPVVARDRGAVLPGVAARGARVLLRRREAARRGCSAPSSRRLALASAVADGRDVPRRVRPLAVYYGTDTACARAARRRGARGVALASPPSYAEIAPAGLRVAGVVGAAILVAAIVRTDDSSRWLYRGGFLGIAIATAAVIAGSHDRAGATRLRAV